MTDTPPGMLMPRLYQEDALSEAVNRNIICRMDTGTGKTLIAVLLTRHITSQPSPKHLPKVHKVCVFVVPTVSLVDQTSAVLKKQTSLRVASFIGAMGVEYWKREEWVKKLQQADVLVMTAQIWLDILTNAYWDLDRSLMRLITAVRGILTPKCKFRNLGKIAAVALIIRLVTTSHFSMKDHYHPHKLRGGTVPRILGLTASPIFNAKNPMKSITELEANLDARIFEVSSRHARSIETAASKPTEILVVVTPRLDNNLPTKSEKLFLAQSEEFDMRVIKRVEVTRQKIGIAGLDLYLAQLAKDLNLSVELQARLDAFAPTKLTPNDISPHVTELFKVLGKYKGRPDFHGICFVEARSHAQVLASLVQLNAELNWLRPAFLVGHGNRGRPENMTSVGMKIKDQQRIVAAFRTGEINLVFATKVAEEGLDFRACNVVIRFDGLQTMTGYIQSRGRAREKQSDFVVLAESNSIEEQVYIRCQQNEPALRAIYGQRIEISEGGEEEPDLPDTPIFRVPQTGAQLTYGTAVPLLSEFCSLIRFDVFAASQRPQYNITGELGCWKCRLETPMIHQLGGSRVFHSGICPSKRSAKQAVAFQACKALYEAGAIDQWLLPVRMKLGNGGKDAYGRTLEEMGVSKSGLWTSYQRVFGVPGQHEDRKDYLHIFELERQGESERFRVGLVVDRSLEKVVAHPETLYTPEGPEMTLRLRHIEVVNWSSQKDRQLRLKLLQEVNRDMTRSVINRRIAMDAEFELLWAPLLDDSIDWKQLEHAFPRVDITTVTPGSLLVILTSGACHLARLDEIRKDVTTLSDTLSIDGSAANKRRKLVDRYPLFSVYIKVAYNCHGLETTTDEPVLTVTSIPRSVPNYLSPPNALDPDHPTVTPRTTTRNYPVSMVHVCNLDPRFWAFVPMIPSLNRLVEDMTRVQITIDEFELPEIERRLLRQALTPPSVASGFNYETLETIGDSFLKLATTLHIYFEFPHLDEGRLSIVRQNSVSNAFLRARNLALGYANAVLAQKFLTAHWSPMYEHMLRKVEDNEGIKDMEADNLTDAKAAALQRKIGRKPLADIIESTLGAALVTGGFQMALETGEKLGLCFGGTTPWHERAGAKCIGLTEATDVPVGLLDLERRLGYKFQHHGRLLLQAITHRSCRNAMTYCYEREEFLGDALLDFWATDRIFKAFPQSTPRHLTFMRAILVSNPTLAFLAIRVLELQKSILHGSYTLEQAMMEAQEQTESMTWEMVLSGDITWLFAPPKVLGDAFEAILGAIYLDAGCRLEPVMQTLDHIYQDVMPLMRNVEMRDPYSRLLIHAQSNSCQKTKVRVTRIPFEARKYEATAFIHDHVIATHANASQNVARQLAARDALEMLQKELQEADRVTPTKSFLGAPCTCRADVEAARVEAERLRKLKEDVEEAEGLAGEDDEVVNGDKMNVEDEDLEPAVEEKEEDFDDVDDEDEDEEDEAKAKDDTDDIDGPARPVSPRRVRNY